MNTFQQSHNRRDEHFSPREFFEKSSMNTFSKRVNTMNTFRKRLKARVLISYRSIQEILSLYLTSLNIYIWRKKYSSLEEKYSSIFSRRNSTDEKYSSIFSKELLSEEKSIHPKCSSLLRSTLRQLTNVQICTLKYKIIH